MQETAAKLLLVEDDPNLGKVLKEYLESKNYEVDYATNGKEAWDRFKKEIFDICILDIMMPIKDGFTLAKEIKRANPLLPLVFLTAKSLKEDTLEGFNIGADDYITKPFHAEELLLRLKAILRRTKQQLVKSSDQKNFTVGKYRFNAEQQVLEYEGGIQKLTTRETELLKLLCLNPNATIDRSFALKTIWGDDNYFNGRSMDVYIAKLRKYLRNDPSVEIMNVHGTGFKLITGIAA